MWKLGVLDKPTWPRSSTVLAAAGALLLLASNHVLEAEEYCVTCAGPEATYRCEVEGTPAGQGSDPRSQLQCITALAQSGGHESCAVSRAGTEPCDGVLKVIAPSTLDVPPEAADQANVEMPAPAEPAPPDAAAGAAEPPRTVEELAKSTVQSSKAGLEKAGEAVVGGAKGAGSAVGTAAKKTWDCLASLFSDC